MESELPDEIFDSLVQGVHSELIEKHPGLFDQFSRSDLIKFVEGLKAARSFILESDSKEHALIGITALNSYALDCAETRD